MADHAKHLLKPETNGYSSLPTWKEARVRRWISSERTGFAVWRMRTSQDLRSLRNRSQHWSTLNWLSGRLPVQGHRPRQYSRRGVSLCASGLRKSQLLCALEARSLWPRSALLQRRSPSSSLQGKRRKDAVQFIQISVDIQPRRQIAAPCIEEHTGIHL